MQYLWAIRACLPLLGGSERESFLPWLGAGNAASSVFCVTGRSQDGVCGIVLLQDGVCRFLDMNDAVLPLCNVCELELPTEEASSHDGLSDVLSLVPDRRKSSAVNLLCLSTTVLPSADFL